MKKKRILSILLALTMILTFMPAMAFAADDNLVYIESNDGVYNGVAGDSFGLHAYAPIDGYSCKWELTEGSDIAVLVPDENDSTLAILHFQDNASPGGVSVRATIMNSKGKKAGVANEFFRLEETAIRMNPVLIPSDLETGKPYEVKLSLEEKKGGGDWTASAETPDNFIWVFDSKMISIKDSEGNTVRSEVFCEGNSYTVERLSSKSAKLVVSPVLDSGFRFHPYYLKALNGYKEALSVSANKGSVKYSAVKKKNQNVKVYKKNIFGEKEEVPVFEANLPGCELSFKKVSGNKKIIVSSAGKVTVKKGLKKGSYTIKVKVSTKGSSAVKAGSKIVKTTIKVK